MSTFYTLEPACDTQETGHVYPQIQKLTSKYDIKKHNSIYSYLKKSGSDFSNDPPDLDAFVLNSSAKATDLVSNAVIGGNGLFVSHRLKDIFERYQLPPHRFYPAKVIHKDKEVQGYYWLHFIADLTDYIDYKRSSFFIYKHFRLNDGSVKIESKHDYLTKREQLKASNPEINITIWSSRIYFKRGTKLEDLFEIGMFDSQLYISKDLRNELVENQITGCKIEETDKVIA